MSAIRGLMTAIIFALAVGYYSGHWGHPKSIKPLAPLISLSVNHPVPPKPSPLLAVPTMNPSSHPEIKKEANPPAETTTQPETNREVTDLYWQAYQIGLEFNQEFGAPVDRFTGLEMTLDQNSSIASMKLRLYGVHVPAGDNEQSVLVPVVDDAKYPAIHAQFRLEKDGRIYAVLSNRYNQEIERHLRLGRISHDRGYAEWYKRIILSDKI